MRPIWRWSPRSGRPACSISTSSITPAWALRRFPPRSKASLRAAWPRTMILCGGFDRASAEAALAAGQADLIAFGRPVLATPDFVKRLERGQAMNALDFSTAYTPGAKGYTDYPRSQSKGPGRERLRTSRGSGRRGGDRRWAAGRHRGVVGEQRVVVASAPEDVVGEGTLGAQSSKALGLAPAEHGLASDLQDARDARPAGSGQSSRPLRRR